uniref:Uncharacterized protein n=1 Tax=Pristionchus pacificus TaxID=54126 RepID=A0A2A6BIS6_PRIPA|eukprot:PDM65835.1 hypothetical protein PRIPAC_45236 [Pristionchus pacificus]
MMPATNAPPPPVLDGISIVDVEISPPVERVSSGSSILKEPSELGILISTVVPLRLVYKGFFQAKAATSWVHTLVSGLTDTRWDTCVHRPGTMFSLLTTGEAQREPAREK